MSALLSYCLDLAHSLTNCMCCFPSSPSLKINNRSFKILRLLGEGGFSYVYLVADTTQPSNLYALKKIRCPFGQESVSLALREVEAYALFAPHPNIIHAIDHAVVSDRKDPSQKTVYILLPYFARGNLQDVINANLVNHTRLSEKRLMVLLLGVCKALKAMHQYKAGVTGRGEDGVQDAKKIRAQAERADEEMRAAAEGEDFDDDDEAEVSANSSKRRKKGKRNASASGEGESEPLMEDEMTSAQDGKDKGAVRAYAHRDIKPGNIMIHPNGQTPILMDLGSLTPSPTPISTRTTALQVQDTAAEHSTLPYRAPELFDVRVGTTVDTKVDIWSLGCTVYACLVGKSPFERRSEETGGSLTMCVLGGDWRFPDEKDAVTGGGQGGGSGSTHPKAKRRDSGKPSAGVAGNAGGSANHKRRQSGSNVGEIAPEPGEEFVLSNGVKEVVRRCLRVEPSERPDVDELMEMVEGVVNEMGGMEGEDARKSIGAPSGGFRDNGGRGGGVDEGAFRDDDH